MVSAPKFDALRQADWQLIMQRAVYASLVIAFIMGGGFIIASEAILPSSTKVTLEAGEVAPRDVLAPRSLNYESTVLTEAKRRAATDGVRAIYDPPDPAVESEQTQLTRQILDYIENVRYDDFATLEHKKHDLAAITALDLPETIAEALLNIEDDDAWRAIDAQVMRLLERVMSGEVREDNIQTIKDGLPNLISASYGETDVQIITAIVGDLIRANAFYNEELTNQAKTAAADNVPVEVRTFAQGQMIIRAGEIATAAHIESLEQFGLLQGTQRRIEWLISGAVAMTLIVALLGTYIRQFQPELYTDPAFLVMLGCLFLIFMAGVRLISAESETQMYLYPASGLAFLIASLIGPQFAIVVIATLAAVAGFMTGDSLEFASLILLTGTLSALRLGRSERLNSYFAAGGVIVLAAIAVAIVFAFSKDNTPSVVTIAIQIFYAILNGLASIAIAVLGLIVVGSVLNIPTNFKIFFELLSHSQPLLQRLLREAPGTYQHSLEVANLSELAAERIGANASLLRAAAMYHDVGKILNPHFFVENQADGVNPHDLLNNPYQSAKIITGHVTEGARLARRYHLPMRIRDFILEHHGTTQVMYFYRQALKQAEQTGDEVDIRLFSYPGPRPQSRETAILMLADGCESSVRARRPQSSEDIRETVDYIFELRLQSGELDESGLTLNDLRLLRDSFLSALQGKYHPRIAYPGTPGQGNGKQLPENPPSQLPSGNAESHPDPHTARTQEFRLPRPFEALHESPHVEGQLVGPPTDKTPANPNAASAPQGDELAEDAASKNDKDITGKLKKPDEPTDGDHAN
ncbi:MAG: HDIG domain-containing protein [Anaerolineae bacterium]|nr:HDIG domain-containing protein [Anaerolineae bacterium]